MGMNADLIFFLIISRQFLFAGWWDKIGKSEGEKSDTKVPSSITKKYEQKVVKRRKCFDSGRIITF